jgi:hypothetical protein
MLIWLLEDKLYGTKKLMAVQQVTAQQDINTKICAFAHSCAGRNMLLPEQTGVPAQMCMTSVTSLSQIKTSMDHK